MWPETHPKEVEWPGLTIGQVLFHCIFLMFINNFFFSLKC